MNLCPLCQNNPCAAESLVCGACATDFAGDEAFAQDFFVAKKYEPAAPAAVTDVEGRIFTYVEYDSACSLPLRKFVLGVLVKAELKCQAEGQTILGPLAEMLFQAYLNPAMMVESFPIFIDRYADSGKLAEEVFTGRIWKLKTNSFFYRDCRFVVFCDGRHVSPKILDPFICKPGRVRAVLP